MALSVSLGALIAFMIVILVYQQVENYILPPAIIGKAADVSGFTGAVPARDCTGGPARPQ